MKHSGASMSSRDTTEHPQTHAEKLRSHRSSDTTESSTASVEEEASSAVVEGLVAERNSVLDYTRNHTAFC